MSERGWRRAREEHQRALQEFAHALEAIPATSWTRAPAPGKWSPAAVTLHVARAYELGDSAIRGGPGMRLRLRPPQAWVLRNVMLPFFLARGRFPRGADAPGEVVPDLEEANRLTVAAATDRLAAAANAALASLAAAGEQPEPPRLRHAYFGDLSPLVTLRLLSLHTRHHARGLARVATSDRGS